MMITSKWNLQTSTLLELPTYKTEITKQTIKSMKIAEQKIIKCFSIHQCIKNTHKVSCTSLFCSMHYAITVDTFVGTLLALY